MYTLKFSVEGRKSLASLDKQVAQRILNKLKWLIQNIDSVIPLPLHGKFSGDYKLRVGDWRVIYEVDRNQMTITVHKIGHRRDIYR
ncbi:type II toxin-antitoxin system RelE/ParE family toxin [Candidatus Poribacteria bacterium]|nr:type II toxin-antitoxin system RelE/ParE family toxin [Candidatus Poribacteria bacterium]